MSPTLTILMMLGAWLAVAGSLLWGMLRIARPRVQRTRQTPAAPHRAIRPLSPHA